MPKVSRRKFIQRTAMVGSIAYAGVLATDNDWLEVTHHQIKLPNWNTSHLRCAVLSDLHLYEYSDIARASMAVKLAASMHPDVILMPGDFLSSSGPESILRLRAFLADIDKYKIPKFACMGNHDANAGQPIWIIKEFNNSLTTMLINDFALFEGIVIAGLDDALHGNPQPEALFSGGFRPFPKDRPVIVMAHEPDYAAELDFGISLAVAGHTHSGQICLPFGIPIHLPELGKNHLAGWYPNGKTPVYVSRGVGMVGPPFRAFCRPEVAILDIGPL